MKENRLTLLIGDCPMRLLQQLYETGLYGFSVEQAAEYILLEGLRQRLAEPVLLKTPKKARRTR